MSALLILSIVVNLWSIQNCDAYNNDACKSSDCVIKCCPQNQISRVTYDEDDNEHRDCVNSRLLTKLGVTNPDDYSDIIVYNKDIQRQVIKTKKRVKDFRLQYVSNFTQGAQCFSSVDISETYLLENGKWTLRRRNYLKQWTVFEPGQFCIEHEVSVYDGQLESTTPSMVVWIVLPPGPPPTNRRALTSAYGLQVSCVFLLLVLLVYSLLPELRNLAGLILMACMSTYFAFFFIRIVHVFGNEKEVLSTNACVTLTIIFHYLTLATFCWMNVMSFDIWWTFRRVQKSRIPRRSIMYKFRVYCAYAWGLPLLPTLFVIIVDRLDLTHLPNFVQPHLFSKCYFEPDTHLLYVSIPILILIAGNLIMFLMSAHNIWKIKQGIDKYKDSANNQKNEYRKIKGTSNSYGDDVHLSILSATEILERANNTEISFFYLFWVYLRLSLLMGVSWILEVIGNLVHTESVVWVISDLYNALIGLFIFLLFVCKKKIFLRLCDRLSINNKFVESVRARTEDSRAADAHNKSSSHTDTSDFEHWMPSYKDIKNKSEQIL